MEKISVAIRVRPLPPSYFPSPSVGSQKWVVGLHNVALYSGVGTPISGQSYSFDHVFGTDAKNGDIYRGLAKDVIMSSLNGFNGTVFAYGQTSSGKTYTMKGTQTDPGLIRLAIRDVFDRLQQLTKVTEFLIRVSYMEIYNEEINDLLAPDNRRLQIHENTEKGIFVAGLREEIVGSHEHVVKLLEFGESHRHFGETNMNLYSSRSHTIFRMVIESKYSAQHECKANTTCDAVRVSCLNLVDLAGSERIAKTGAGGVRLKEGTYINRSLMTLGTVINKLSEGAGKQGGHVPYRDSKLTRILQPALGGNSKTVMICTVTLDEIHIDETRGTLQFATRAKRVSTWAQVNEVVTETALLKRQMKEIGDLRMKLQDRGQSAHLEKEILTLRNALLKFELEKEKLEFELQEEKRARVVRERQIRDQEQKIANLSTLFMNKTLDDLTCQRSQKDSRRDGDKTDDDETMTPVLYSVRRERNLSLPPAFEIGEDSDLFWTTSIETEEPSALSDFENIADEDTWISLNKGHKTACSLISFGFSGRDRLSAGSAAAQKIAFLETEPRDLQVECKEFQNICNVKSLEDSKGLQEELLVSRRQFEKAQNETLYFKNELCAQLEMQRELQHSLEKLEFEMGTVQSLMRSMQGLLAESLHLQAMVLVTLEHFGTLAPTKHNSEAKEQRLVVEDSVEQCMDTCVEVDQALHACAPYAHRAALQNATEVPKTIIGLENNPNQLKIYDCTYSLEVDGTKIQPISDPSVFPILNTSSDLRESEYCNVRSSFLFRNLRMLCNGPAMLCNDLKLAAGHAYRLKDFPCTLCEAPVHSYKAGGYSSISQRESLNPLLNSLSGAHLKGRRAHVVRAVPSLSNVCLRPQVAGRRVNIGSATAAISNGFMPSHHVKCPYSASESNRPNCDWHEKAVLGKHQIPSEIRNLCFCILSHFQAPMGISNLGRVHDGDGVEVQQGGKLRTYVASAKLFGSWLLEEVQAIEPSDVDCSRSRAKDRGNIGFVFKFRTVDLQHENSAVALFSAICQDESLMTDLQERSAFKDDQDWIQGLAERSQEVGTISKTNKQEIMGVVSVDVDCRKVDVREREDPFSTLGVLDWGTKLPLETFSKYISASEIQEQRWNEQASMIERLRMLNEDIVTLDRRLSVLYIEKNRIMKALIEEVDAKEQASKSCKIEKKRLASNLNKFIAKVSVHDEVLTRICLGVTDFEQLMRRRPLSGWKTAQR